MSTADNVVSAEEVASSARHEHDVEKLFQDGFLNLTDDERAQLSKVLFPDTHTKTVAVCGKTLTLSPVPIKIAKKIFASLSKFSETHQKALETRVGVEIDNCVIEGMFYVARILGDHYGWPDEVMKALDEENVTTTELQDICFVQQRLNGANDFLLARLRVLVRTMQIGELANIRFQTVLTTPLSAKSNTAV